MRRDVGVLRIGSLGDQLIALPAYRRLRELHRHDRLSLISNALAGHDTRLVGPASILPAGLFDDFHSYPVGRGWQAVAATLDLLRGLHLDVLYYLMPRRNGAQLWRDWVFFRVVGLRVIGLQLLDALHGQRSRYLPDLDVYEREADRLQRLIPALSSGPASTAQRPSLELSPLERAEARALLAPLSGCAIAISVGTKFEVNHWGSENWGLLVERLAAVGTIDRLLLIGSAAEYAECEALKARWGATAVNFCGRLSPRQSAAVMAECSLFVGHDSGPMHMAAAVGVPIVAVFSSRNPRGVWYPMSANSRVHYTKIDCMGCERARCDDRKKACIMAISVDEVLTSCRAALSPVDANRRDRKVLISGGTDGARGRAV